MKQLVDQQKQKRRLLVFPEDRMYPVKMKNSCHRWIQKGANSFSGKAERRRIILTSWLYML
jgi:hypothetical protein